VIRDAEYAPSVKNRFGRARPRAAVAARDVERFPFKLTQGSLLVFQFVNRI